MSVRVKICGITSVEDGLAAIDAGADALGFMFYEKSSRHVSVAAAAAIIRELPPLVARVGVFVNATASLVRETISQSGIDTLQFHGDEAPEFCSSFELKYIKAFRVKDEASLAQLGKYPESAWLLDAFVPGQLGGTGATFNWELAKKAKTLGNPIILAGGLTPENVVRAVQEVKPFALDVSSGVEAAPGKKDAKKMAGFIRLAKQCLFE